MIPDKSEADRQAIEQAQREREAAAKRTAETNAAMNRLLRGEPSKEQEEQKKQISEKARKRLEKIALDEDSPEDAAWARGVLDGKTDINGDPIKTRAPKSADGGEGVPQDSQWSPFRPLTFTEQVREAMLNKRYGVRHTNNHLLPGSES